MLSALISQACDSKLTPCAAHPGSIENPLRGQSQPPLPYQESTAPISATVISQRGVWVRRNGGFGGATTSERQWETKVVAENPVPSSYISTTVRTDDALERRACKIPRER